ncbi:hypothetical protein ACNKHU_00080 [Shigella flexneri]
MDGTTPRVMGSTEGNRTTPSIIASLQDGETGTIPLDSGSDKPENTLLRLNT